MGWIRTIMVGLIGTFLGNYVAPKMFDWPAYTPFSIQGIGIGIALGVASPFLNKLAHVQEKPKDGATPAPQAAE